MALIKCPECGKEVSEKATNCPNCGHPLNPDQTQFTGNTPQGGSSQQQLPPKRKGSCLKTILIVFGVIFVIIILFSCFGGGSSNDTKKIEKTNVDSEENNDAGQASKPSETTESKEEDASEDIPEDVNATVGDTIDDNGILVTLVSCEEYISDNEYIVPADGKKYIKATFEIQNTSDNTQTISSYVSFSAYADDYSIDQTYVGSEDSSLDGEITSGKKLNGSIFYEIPVDTKTLQIDYISNYWTDRRTSFIINF